MVPLTGGRLLFLEIRRFPAWTIDGLQSVVLLNATLPVQSRVSAVRGHIDPHNETTRLTMAMTVRPASSSQGSHSVNTPVDMFRGSNHHRRRLQQGRRLRRSSVVSGGACSPRP